MYLDAHSAQMPARVFPSPERRYVLLQLSDGTFLTHDPTSARARLDVAPHCGDDACWLLQPAEGARNSRLVHHSGSVELFGAVVGSSTGDDEDPLSDPVWELLIPSELELPESWAKSATGAMRMNVVVVEGPGSLPSEYLSTLATDGFVVCPNLLGDRLLGRLRHDIRQMRASPELQDQGVPAGAPGDSQVNQGRAAVRETAGRVDLINCINESANFVRMATHPVMQHMLTSYLGTTAVRLAHAPAVGITKPLGLAVGPDGALVEEQKGGGGWVRRTLLSLHHPSILSYRTDMSSRRSTWTTLCTTWDRRFRRRSSWARSAMYASMISAYRTRRTSSLAPTRREGHRPLSSMRAGTSTSPPTHRRCVTLSLSQSFSCKDTCHSPSHFIIQSWSVLVAGPGGRPD